MLNYRYFFNALYKWYRHHRIAAALLLSAAAGSANADPLQDLHSFLGMETFKASFTQQVYDERNSLIENSTGIVAIRRPGRFRWEYLQPSRQLMVSDGFNFIIYDPELEQATIRPLAISLGHAPIMLLLRQNPSFEDFEIQTAQRREGLDWVVLTPKVQDMEFTRIELGLEQKKITRIRMQDHFDQITIINFIRADFNTAVPAETFRLHLPERTDLIGRYPTLKE